MALWFRRSAATRAPDRPFAIPTIAFDRRWTTRAVRSEVKEAVSGLAEVPRKYRGRVYRAAIKWGPPRNLGALREAIEAMAIPGLSHADAVGLTHRLANVATSTVTEGAAK